jgi:hypothetical protein
LMKQSLQMWLTMPLLCLCQNTISNVCFELFFAVMLLTV